MVMKIGIVKLTSCMGCEVEIIKNKEFFELKDKIDFVYFPMAKKGKVDESFDIIFCEGAVSSEEELQLIKNAREKARLLIALGTCAVTGGISAQRNYLPNEQRIISRHKLTEKAFPIEKVVKIDYKIRGCPIIGDEFYQVLKDVSAGKTLRERNFPVCLECKQLEIECLLKKGIMCAGPITQGGCKAICPFNSVGCKGCRGFVKDAEMESWMKDLEKYGIRKDEAEEILKIFNP
jgi:sulfhydrogenase subunit delta